jgi:hypothetical protein
MFWIIAGVACWLPWAETNPMGWLQVVAEQMHHVKWKASILKILFSPYLCLLREWRFQYAITSKVEKAFGERNF